MHYFHKIILTNYAPICKQFASTPYKDDLNLVEYIVYFL